ncbi:MAG: hypothetical protein AAF363_08020 [Bacteroidota bacterium]
METSQHWLADLHKYDADKMSIKPTKKQWCMAELYDHLMKVANTYQLPNFHLCLENGDKLKARKNLRARIIFDLQLLPYRKMKLESFPEEIANSFTPEIKKKPDLLSQFERWIKLVEEESLRLDKIDMAVKHFHPLFGWINAIEWFSLIEIHIRHHTRQKQRIEKLVFNK